MLWPAQAAFPPHESVLPLRTGAGCQHFSGGQHRTASWHPVWGGGCPHIQLVCAFYREVEEAERHQEIPPLRYHFHYTRLCVCEDRVWLRRGAFLTPHWPHMGTIPTQLTSSGCAIWPFYWATVVSPQPHRSVLSRGSARCCVPSTNQPPASNHHPAAWNFHPPACNHHPAAWNFHPPASNHHPTAWNFHPPAYHHVRNYFIHRGDCSRTPAASEAGTCLPKVQHTGPQRTYLWEMKIIYHFLPLPLPLPSSLSPQAVITWLLLHHAHTSL